MEEHISLLKSQEPVLTHESHDGAFRGAARDETTSEIKVYKTPSPKSSLTLKTLMKGSPNSADVLQL